ncbi:hypothetical protein BCV72DRAFT_182984, partial [Rhizopus microsporus var. microsporus]
PIESELYEKLEIGQLPTEQKLHLKKLLNKYRHIFDWYNDTIGHTNLLQHKIIVEENTLPI